MSSLFTALAVFIWIGLGAAAVLLAWMLSERKRLKGEIGRAHV